MARRLVPVLLLALAAAAHDWNGMARAGNGALYVIDAEDGQIWKVSAKGAVSVFVAGEKAKRCNHPHHLALDRKGALWLAGG
jgi:hypothetical protein